jgi:hypothetical protein
LKLFPAVRSTLIHILVFSKVKKELLLVALLAQEKIQGHFTSGSTAVRATTLDFPHDFDCEERSNHNTNLYEVHKTLFERVAFFCFIIKSGVVDPITFYIIV